MNKLFLLFIGASLLPFQALAQPVSSDIQKQQMSDLDKLRAQPEETDLGKVHVNHPQDQMPSLPSSDHIQNLTPSPKENTLPTLSPHFGNFPSQPESSGQNSSGQIASLPPSPPLQQEDPADQPSSSQNGVISLHGMIQVARFEDSSISGAFCYITGPTVPGDLLDKTREGGSIVPKMSLNCMIQPNTQIPAEIPTVESVSSMESMSFAVDRIWDPKTRSLLYVLTSKNRDSSSLGVAATSLVLVGSSSFVPASPFDFKPSSP